MRPTSLPIAASLLLAASFVHGIPTPASIFDAPAQPELVPRAACTIGIDMISWWWEAALVRCRYRPTQVGLGLSDSQMLDVISNYWNKNRGTCSSIATANVQIFESKVYGPVVDDSEVGGPVGANVHECILEEWLDQWRQDTGCDIKPGSCGIRGEPACEAID